MATAVMELIGNDQPHPPAKRMKWIGNLNLASQTPGIMTSRRSLARRVLAQDRHQRGRKVYSLHAPEVECIDKGKAHKPYEFGPPAKSDGSISKSNASSNVVPLSSP